MNALNEQEKRRMKTANFLHRFSVGALCALLVLTIAWELWLAPLRPGGSWLALKALPLAAALRGIIARNVYTYRWSTMLVLAYMAEGCVRAYSEAPPASTLAVWEIGLAAVFYMTAIAYVRQIRPASVARP